MVTDCVMNVPTEAKTIMTMPRKLRHSQGNSCHQTTRGLLMSQRRRTVIELQLSQFQQTTRGLMQDRLQLTLLFFLLKLSQRTTKESLEIHQTTRGQ